MVSVDPDEHSQEPAIQRGDSWFFTACAELLSFRSGDLRPALPGIPVVAPAAGTLGDPDLRHGAVPENVDCTPAACLDEKRAEKELTEACADLMSAKWLWLHCNPLLVLVR